MDYKETRKEIKVLKKIIFEKMVSALKHYIDENGYLTAGNKIVKDVTSYSIEYSSDATLDTIEYTMENDELCYTIYNPDGKVWKSGVFKQNPKCFEMLSVLFDKLCKE